MKIIYLIALFLVLQLPLYAADSGSVSQEEVCYSQCAAYRLVWMDDYCWGTFQHFCSMDKEDVGVQLVGAWASLAGAGADFGILINAYTCVELVDGCIQPILDECEATCAQDPLRYAPNLYVENAYYSESEEYLYLNIRNGGRAYMPASTVEVFGAHTDEGNPPDSAFTRIISTSVPDLRPHEIRYIALDIPDEQTLVINWQPQPDKYNVARVVITPAPGRQEISTRDNTYDFIINDLPLPASLVLSKPYFERAEPSTSLFAVYVPLENRGELGIDTTVEFYLGHPKDGNLIGSQQVHFSGGQSRLLEQDVQFTSPLVNYVTIVIYEGDEVLYESTQYASPQFLHIKGKVTDEAGNPLADVRVSNSAPSSSDFPLSGGTAITVLTDSRGNYDFHLLSTEGTVTLYAAKNGYYSNQASVSFEYPEDVHHNFYSEKFAYADIVLLQHPMEISIGYPVPGRYIIETDKGRFTGQFFPQLAIPVHGSNGTIAVFSPLCSPMISNFSTPYAGSQLPAPDVTCLTPDANDDYTLLSAQELVFEKEYPDEIPEWAYFDKRGDHVYVITINKEDSLCNIYSYSLPGGQQLYKKELNSHCLQSSNFIPAYDGSLLYAAIGVPKIVKGGTNVSMGHIYSENGQPVREWVYPKMTYNLEPATATEFLDLLAHPGYYYRGEKVENCMLSEAQPCREGGTGYQVKSLGIAGNRAVSSCNSSYCVVTLGHDDYVEIPSYVVNSMIEGNYQNRDIFMGSYKGGSYIHDGMVSWEIEEDIDDVSMSPGGSYILVGFDPYKISVFDSSGTEHVIDGAHKTGARGLEATERGLFYATTKGGKMSIYRLSTLSEPQSGIQGEEGTESFFWFVSTFFQALVDIFNGMVDFFASFLP